jgi:hypothetical protein
MYRTIYAVAGAVPAAVLLAVFVEGMRTVWAGFHPCVFDGDGGQVFD